MEVDHNGDETSLRIPQQFFFNFLAVICTLLDWLTSEIYMKQLVPFGKAGREKTK